MDENIKNDMIRAYLWQEVIMLAFLPSRGKDQKTWLQMYNKSINEFWETDEYPPSPSSHHRNEPPITGEITYSAIDMLFDYTISNNSTFAVRLLHTSNTKDLMWTHDVDSRYFIFPIQSILNQYNKRKTFLKEDISHIESVLDGLIFHPRVHQHIESPLNNHEIRIGGGIDNPFLYLFHLRYQLCPISEKRDNEKKRLIELFTNAIKNKSKTDKSKTDKSKITPKDLFMRTW
ncbi:hypothetical protein QUF76_05305 [Desulfobacterales bacterium HSG16]|nr:hypothetical protein [Desulfobacterales bacterium HSG16]